MSKTIKEISKEIIKDAIKREMGKRYPEGKVMETTVIKNNTSKLGISIKLPNIKITPVVYVDDMYDYYNNVNDLDDTLNKAISLIESSINSIENTKLDDTVSNLIESFSSDKFIFPLFKFSYISFFSFVLVLEVKSAIFNL